MLNPHAVEQTCVVLLGLLLVFRRTTGRRRQRLLSGLARKRWPAVVAVGLAALAIRAALLPLHPAPEPAKADEFSYLLAADTFARGRAVNPPHPLWMSFETLNELSQPKYVSKYPPAQGVVLAAGILLARNPWIGVWLSIGAMCAAVVWMLQGWLPPRWALLGGLLVLLRIGIGSYWIDSYWGGAVAATGGALLYGALPRLMRRGRPRDSLILGASLAILANSRPFEGLLLALPALTVLAVWAVRRGWTSLRALWPTALVLAATAWAMMAYNAAVTGSPWVMPHQMFEARYAVAPLFWFQKLRPEPVYNNGMLKAAWTGWALDVYLNNFRSGLVVASLAKLENLRVFYLGTLLALPLIVLPWAIRARRFRLIYVALGLSLVGMLGEIDIVPHYAAPATALLYLVVVQCLRHLYALGPAGRAAARGIPMLLAGTVLALYSMEAGGARFLHEHYSWCFAMPGNLERARIARQLENTEGRHLVLVRYAPQHFPFNEWVFNRADIDRAKVVWARELDAGRNAVLLDYFRSRRAWLIEPDTPHPALRPYPQLSLVNEKP